MIKHAQTKLELRACLVESIELEQAMDSVGRVAMRIQVQNDSLRAAAATMERAYLQEKKDNEELRADNELTNDLLAESESEVRRRKTGGRIWKCTAIVTTIIAIFK